MTNRTPGQAGKDALRTIAKWTGTPVWNRLRPRIETIVIERSDAMAGRLRTEIAELRTDLHRQLSDLHAEVATTHTLAAELDWAQNELRRITPHIAAVDERVGVLERTKAVYLDTDTEQRSEARSLVEEIRAEHARIRARLSAVASYEHRIAKMEQTLTALTGNTN
jgi:chromosome segregation ATPase